MTEPNLFGMTQKPKRAKAAPAPNGAVQSLIGSYVRLFMRRFNGEKPHIAPADGRALKQLVTQYGAEKVEQRLPVFMALDDTYIADAGYSLRLMPGAWNKLTATVAKRPASDGAVRQTSEYLKKLRGVNE